MEIWVTWTTLKSLKAAKTLSLQYYEEGIFYKIFGSEDGVTYRCDINKTDPKSLEQIDFEDNYMAECNQPVHPVDEYNKQYVRAGSRPLDKTTYFTMIGDSDTGIADGKQISWDFATAEDLILDESAWKRKRVEFKFIDNINIKEGAIYFFNAPFGSYIDLSVVCPAGAYYLANDKTPRYAFVDTPIDHFVSHHMMYGDCPMGDELNTEEASMEVPFYYKYWIEITAPVVADLSKFKGFCSLEIYRPRTCILP